MTVETIWCVDNVVSAGLSLSYATYATYVVSADTADAYLHWLGETWTFTYQTMNALTTGTVTAVKIKARLFQSGWSDDEFKIQCRPGVGTWQDLETFDSGNPPPSSLVTKEYTQLEDGTPLENLFDTIAKCSNAEVRITSTAKTGAEDSVHWYVYWTCLGVTYTPGALEVKYYAISSGCKLWGWYQITVGDQTLQSPGSRTPSDLQYYEYPTESRQDVSDDDEDYAQYGCVPGAGQTGRACLMIEFSGITQTNLQQLIQRCRGSHLQIAKIVRLYLWNFNDDSWDDLGDQLESTSGHQCHDSVIAANPEYYVENGTAYFLEWDYSGEYVSEGCLLPDTILTLLNGKQKRVSSVRIGDVLRGWLPNHLTEARVVEKIVHQREGEWEIVTLKGKDFEITVTGIHAIYTPNGIVSARALKKGDKVRIWKNGDLVDSEILELKYGTFKGKVYDFKTFPTENLFVGNVLVHNVVDAWK